MTPPVLFALARGESYTAGSQRCYYCGGSCDDSHAAAQLVRDSFTSRDTVALGEYVCGGCVASMNEKAAVTLPDGEVRHGQKVRGYTWVITRSSAVAATKAHRDYLLCACLNPPEPPFVICLSESGQKHLLYRAAVCHAQDVVTVTLEGERITYQPESLADRVRLAKQISAAVGKPALSASLSVHRQMVIASAYGADVLTCWLSVRQESLSRLAAFLCPPSQECQREFPRP